MKKHTRKFILGLFLLFLWPSAAWLQIAEDPRYDPLLLRAEIDFQEGFDALQQLDYEEAAFRLERALSLYPYPNASYWLGISYQRLGRLKEARRSFQKEIELGVGEVHMAQQALSQLDQLLARSENTNPILQNAWQGSLPLGLNLGAPASVFPLDNGNLAVCDFTGGAMYVVAPNGENLLKIGKLKQPYDVVQDDQGSFFISEFGADQIRVFDSRGNFLRNIGSVGIDEGQLRGPKGLALDGKGNLLVADSGNGRIQKFEAKTGRLIAVLGGRQNEDFRLMNPTALALKDDRVYVADQDKTELIVLDMNGNMIRSWTHPDLKSPLSVTSVSDGVLVGDRGGGLYRVFESENRIAPQVDAEGEPIRFGMPMDLSVDQHEVLYVADAEEGACRRLQPFLKGESSFRVEIRQVSSASYPDIVIYARVLDAEGRPVRGLRKEHFRVLEGQRLMVPYFVEPIASAGIPPRLVAVVDKGITMRPEDENYRDVVNSLMEGIPPATTMAVLRSSQGEMLYFEPVSSPLLLKERLTGGEYGGEAEILPALDQAVRVLLGRREPKGVLLFTTGAFDRREEELRRIGYFAHFNRIPLHVVHFSNEKNEDLEWMARVSRGNYYLVYGGESAVKLVENIKALSVDLYRLGYRSGQIGREVGEWIPLSVESYYLNWNSYDQSGYFVPNN